MPIRHRFIAALTTSVVAVGFIASASAADLVSAPPQAPAFYPDAGLALATDKWTGFYAGASAGYMTSNDFNENNSAWTGGVQAGYLQQFGMFVVGAEAQASISNELNYELAPGAGLKQNWSVSGLARGGVALGDTLIYNVAGVTFAELEGTGATTSEKAGHAGLIFGAGVEQALGDNFSVRAEYLQSRYFEVESTVAGVARKDDLVDHTVKLGVNYRF
jgi:opacity protein-like surface antigen